MIKRIAKIVISSFVTLAIFAAAFIGVSMWGIMHNMTASNAAQALLNNDMNPSEPTVPDSLPNDFYMLLLGVDSSENRESGEEAQFYNGSFRSDTIIVAHVNLDKKKISMCSIERDIKTVIDGYESDGYYKINAAYALGGVDLMKKEAEDLVGVDIPYYAIVDMDGLTEVIDAFGGIEVDVENAFFDQQLQDGIAQGGPQLLNGQQAVLYSRSRYAWAEGDFARARHQREVLKALADKIMTGSDLIGLYNASETISTKVATNLTLPQMFEIAAKMKGFDAQTDIYSMMTPTVGEYTDGVSYQILDEDEWERVLGMLIDLEDPDAPTPEEIAAQAAAEGDPMYDDLDADGYYDADADTDMVVTEDEWASYTMDHPEAFEKRSAWLQAKEQQAQQQSQS